MNSSLDSALPLATTASNREDAAAHQKKCCWFRHGGWVHLQGQIDWTFQGEPVGGLGSDSTGEIHGASLEVAADRRECHSIVAVTANEASSGAETETGGSARAIEVPAGENRRNRLRQIRTDWVSLSASRRRLGGPSS